MTDLAPLRLRIEQAGSTVLHHPSRSVTLDELRSDTIQHLIDMMFATLAGTGVGLAAPQVGVGLQIVVIEDPVQSHSTVPPELLREQERVPVPPHVLVNPRLEILDTEVAEFFEGCLSVDGFRAIVPRARQVRVRALDRSGNSLVTEVSGWYARIIQHELDHLDGRLYLERMLPRTFVTAAHAAQRWTKLPISEAKRLLA